MHPTGADEMHWEKSWRELHKNTANYIELILDATSPEKTATYILYLKPPKKDEQGMRVTAGKVRTNS